MHNFFTGTAERMVRTWMETEDPPGSGPLLTKTHLDEMEQELDTTMISPGYTISRRNIASRFSGMFSDELRTWTVALSPVLLKGKLHSKHLSDWMNFVEAARILCKPCVHLYGKSFVTLNMHLHGHLQDTVLDFGPCYA